MTVPRRVRWGAAPSGRVGRRAAPRHAATAPRRGAVLVLVALGVVVLVGMVAVAIDLGRQYVAAAELQTAADAAALGGVRGHQLAAEDRSYGYYAGAVNAHTTAAGNTVIGAPGTLTDARPKRYDTTGVLTDVAWYDANAIETTVGAVAPAPFARAIGRTPPVTRRRATAWIANMVGADCVLPLALPYTSMYNAGIVKNGGAAYATGTAPGWTQGDVVSLRSVDPDGRTYLLVPPAVDTAATGNNGRWAPAAFGGAAAASYQGRVAGARTTPTCADRTARARIGDQVPVVAMASDSVLLDATALGMAAVCNMRAGDAGCYATPGASVPGRQLRVVFADPYADPAAQRWLRVRRVTLARVMCYFRAPTDQCTGATHASLANAPGAPNTTAAWMGGGAWAMTGRPRGTLVVMLQGPITMDLTPDVVLGTNVSLAQRLLLVK